MSLCLTEDFSLTLSFYLTSDSITDESCSLHWQKKRLDTGSCFEIGLKIFLAGVCWVTERAGHYLKHLYHFCSPEWSCPPISWDSSQKPQILTKWTPASTSTSSRVTELLSEGFQTADICLRQNEYTAFSPCPLFLWVSFCLSLSFSIENLSKGGSLPWFPTIAQHLKIWSVPSPDQAANTATASQDTYRKAAMCEGKSGGGGRSSGHSGYN